MILYPKYAKVKFLYTTKPFYDREVPSYAADSAPIESTDHGAGERPQPSPVPTSSHSSTVTVSPAAHKTTVVVPKKRKYLTCSA